MDRGAAARKTLDIIRHELNEGYSLIIFPEGTRGKPGIIDGFRSGIGQIAVDFPDIPIYPVYLQGPEKSLPKGSVIPVPFNVNINTFQPVYGRDYLHLDQKDARKEITHEIERVIRSTEKNR